MLLELILGVLPQLVGAVAGGKVADVVAAGTKVAREVLGTDDPAEIKAALSDPATAEAFRARLEQETAQLQAYLADVQDARRQTIALVEAGSAIAWAPVVISGLIIAGFLGVTGAMLFKAVPESAVAQILFGQLAGMTGAVVQYWLGSSQSSRAKDQVLASLASPARDIAGAPKRAVK